MLVDKDWLKNVNSLTDNERFNAFVESMRAELALQDIANRRNAGEMMYRGQGKALFLAELISAIDLATRRHV